MPELKCVLIFQGSGYGWTEAYWKEFSSENFDAARDIVVVLAQRRAALCGSNTIIEAIRISNGEDIGRKGKTYYGGWTGDPNFPPASASDAVNVELRTVNNTEGKLVQMRGLRDEFLIGPAVNRGDPTFVTLFNSYAEYIVSQGFGWRGVFAEQSFRITGYTVSATGQVTFVTPDSEAYQYPLGKKRKVRIRQLNGKSKLNGAQIVRRKSATLWELAKPTAAVAFVSEGEMILQTYAFRKASNVSVQRVGRRPAGSPLLRSVGRERERVRV
jgi:hypothetical protein